MGSTGKRLGAAIATGGASELSGAGTLASGQLPTPENLGLGGLFDPGGSTSTLQTQQFPGIFGAGEDPRRLAQSAESLLGQGFDFGALQQSAGERAGFGPLAQAGQERAGFGGLQQAIGALQQAAGGSPSFLGQLQQELSQPSFGPQSAAEQGLLSSILEQTQGQTAARGLGPATQGALGQAIAPTLAGLRQQRVSNLGQALGLEQAGIGQRLGALGQVAGLQQAGVGLQQAGIGQRIGAASQLGQLQQAGIGQRTGGLAQLLGLQQAGVGQRLGGLLELGGLSMPQIIAGQQQTSRQPGLGVSILGGGASGAAQALVKRL